jgi:hypothetical protein
LLANDHDRNILDTRDTPTDCRIIAKMPITFQFFKIAKNILNIIQCIGAIGVPCHLRDLPAAKVLVDITHHMLLIFFKVGDFVRNIYC